MKLNDVNKGIHKNTKRLRVGRGPGSGPGSGSSSSSSSCPFQRINTQSLSQKHLQLVRIRPRQQLIIKDFQQSASKARTNRLALLLF